MKIATPIQKIIVTIFLIFAAGSLRAQVSYTIRFENLSGKNGTLYIGWYDKAEGFREPGSAVIQKKVDVEGSKYAEVLFENVKPGIYAVAVFFDTDNDGKLDTNLLGIPKERYGFSNNVYPTFRAANFKEASFPVNDNNRRQTIRLR